MTGAVSYDESMTTRITVSLPDHLVEQARRAVERGQAASVSAYVAEAMQWHGPREDLRTLLDDLDAELGPPTAEQRAWARKQLELDDR